MAKMTKKTRNLLLNLAFVAVLVAVTLVVLFVNHKELNFSEIADYFNNSNPVWIVGAFACMLLFIIFEGISIFLVNRFFGHKTKLISAIAYSSADTFYSAVTPTAAGGQPAAVYYMARDGMSAGKASFGMLFNTICYTGAIFVVGIIALCINPTLFGGIDAVFAQVLVIAGAVIQAGLMGLYIGCMFFGKAILKIGNGLITFLNKIKIIKNTEKWRNRIEEEVTKYSESRHVLKDKPAVYVTTLLFNILQRVSQTLIPCFVCLAIDPNAPFLEIFALQALVLFGYNSIPLPGGVGAYEYLFIHIYGQMYDKAFILLALMISRLFSYYFNMLVSGVVTLVYHMVKVKKVPAAEGNEVVPDGEEEVAPDGEDGEGEQPAEDGAAVEAETCAQASEKDGEAEIPEEDAL